jgi:hypothetical protein
MKITIKKDSEAAKAFESLREDKQEFKENVQSGKTLSPFLEGYEQINQNNPVTRGSTALVRVSKSTSYQTEISDEEIKKAGEEWCHSVGEDGFVNSGDDYDIHELPAFIAGAKWYREHLKQRQ